MTDLETYKYWVTNYDAISTRALHGELSDESADRIIRNMEERLGMDKWTVERWQAVYEAWDREMGA